MAVKFKKSRAQSMLDITPLIDIVFLLLIFFVVMTRFDEEDYKLDVVLPTASEAKPLISQPRELFVNIDVEGRFFVRGQQYTIDEIDQLLAQTAADNPESTIIIRADKDSKLEYSIQVMNACNKAKLSNYSISTASIEPTQ
ncbi:ExbD/TolR family protein [Blastopirellula marina]|uniref:Biopolymer transporter ExbD n=1 Tax=Blastopirellula marina TaxID=124 RepID=A0A2S8F827_9BACT|nr:biopolymer transporter ExbD [Blastopirellula marina]PQO28305.1 biopolymer transporter ExbD [Blastopirellula marina]PTL41845.1 biopolymer transporter ExbD [Blastopirellula marina]